MVKSRAIDCAVLYTLGCHWHWQKLRALTPLQFFKLLEVERIDSKYVKYVDTEYPSGMITSLIPAWQMAEPSAMYIGLMSSNRYKNGCVAGKRANWLLKRTSKQWGVAAFLT